MHAGFNEAHQHAVVLRGAAGVPQLHYLHHRRGPCQLPPLAACRARRGRRWGGGGSDAAAGAFGSGGVGAGGDFGAHGADRLATCDPRCLGGWPVAARRAGTAPVAGPIVRQAPAVSGIGDAVSQNKYVDSVLLLDRLRQGYAAPMQGHCRLFV